MQVQNPCPNHQTTPITSLCLTKTCDSQPLFCKHCEQAHYTHNTIPYIKFQSTYKQLQQIVQNSVKKIQQQFIKVKQTFAVCIKKTQQRVIKQIVQISSMIPKLEQIEVQQRYGIIKQVVGNQYFCGIFRGGISILQYQKSQIDNIADLPVYIDQMNTSIMASINKFMSQLKINTINKSLIKNKNILIDLPSDHYKFSQKYKPKQFEISQHGKCITRNTAFSQGLTMYCVTEQPLSKQHHTISFKIDRQKQRFIYFGVCDNETFRNFNFRGNLYEMGNKMWAIRQSSKDGANAVCLHNSLQEFSNTDRVPWDFTVGDIVSIRYNQGKNSVSFVKNAEKVFQMPLDGSIKKFYPFVGLKFLGDSVKIMSQDSDKEKEKDSQSKKKGIFSLFQ